MIGPKSVLPAGTSERTRQHEQQTDHHEISCQSACESGRLLFDQLKVGSRWRRVTVIRNGVTVRHAVTVTLSVTLGSVTLLTPLARTC